MFDSVGRFQCLQGFRPCGSLGDHSRGVWPTDHVSLGAYCVPLSGEVQAGWEETGSPSARREVLPNAFLAAIRWQCCPFRVLRRVSGGLASGDEPLSDEWGVELWWDVGDRKRQRSCQCQPKRRVAAKSHYAKAEV